MVAFDILKIEELLKLYSTHYLFRFLEDWLCTNYYASVVLITQVELTQWSLAQPRDDERYWRLYGVLQGSSSCAPLLISYTVQTQRTSTLITNPYTQTWRMSH